MPAAVPRRADRFAALRPEDLSPAEQSSLADLALAVLSLRCRPGRPLDSSEAVRKLLRLRLGERRNEVFGMIYLDNRHRLIEIAEHFQGTVDGAPVYPRAVVQRALERNAAAALAFHNHPSGRAEPSAQDIAVTEKLKQALALVDVRLLDHFVVCGGGAVSFAERGLI